MSEFEKVDSRRLEEKGFVTMGGEGDVIGDFDREDIVVHGGEIIYHPGKGDCFEKYESAFRDLLKTDEFKISCGGTSMGIIHSYYEVIGGRFGEFPTEPVQYVVPERNIHDDGFNLLMKRISEDSMFEDRFDEYLKLSYLMLTHRNEARATTAMKYLYREIAAADEFDKFEAIEEICEDARTGKTEGRYSLVKGLVSIVKTIEDPFKRMDALSNIALILSELGSGAYCRNLFVEAVSLSKTVAEKDLMRARLMVAERMGQAGFQADSTKIFKAAIAEAKPSCELVDEHLHDIVSAIRKARLDGHCLPLLKEAVALIGKCEGDDKRGAIIRECARAVPLLAAKRKALRLLKMLRRKAGKIEDKNERKMTTDVIAHREWLVRI